MFARNPSSIVRLPRELLDPWFWVGIGGIALMLASLYAEDQGRVRFGGDAGTWLGLVVSLTALQRSSTKAQMDAHDRRMDEGFKNVREGLDGVRGEVATVREGVHSVRTSTDAVRGELRDGLRPVLEAIRDRLPPGRA
jgi:hypothetical protein